MKIKQLGKPAFDSTTQQRVTPIKLQFQRDEHHSRWYVCQPEGLNPETGQPGEHFWATEPDLDGPTVEIPDPPLHLMGKEAECCLTGFKGRITDITIHLSGCVHVHLQPPGKDPKTGGKKASLECNVNYIKGPEIKEKTDEERAADQAVRPSPISSVCGTFLH